MKKNHQVYHIVAVDKKHGIGKDEVLPWHFKTDLKHFYDITTKTQDPNKQNMVIMGRKTWFSIPEKFRPLKHRKNYILTRNPEFKVDGAGTINSIDQIFNTEFHNIETIFIIGGGSVFNESIKHEELDGIYLTKICNEYECDTFFPEIPHEFNKITELKQEQENGIELQYFLYEK